MVIHDTQKKILSHFGKNRNRRVTIQELTDEFNLSSTSVAHHHIKQLEKKGYIIPNPDDPKRYIAYETPRLPMAYLKLYGRAKCGADGNILSGEPIDEIAIDSSLIKGDIEDAFLIYADGDSMRPMIENGDIVIGRMNKAVEDGDVIIGALNNEAFIKKFKRISQHQVLLASINPSYDPIIVTEHDHLSIDGHYAGLIRN